MMKLNKTIYTMLAFVILAAPMAHSEIDELQRTEASLEASAKDPSFSQNVQSKYKLTDAQMKAMGDAGVKGPQLAMTAQLAASSGKSIDEIIKMRTDGKMGWGKIAKELGVSPSEIGQSVASLKHGEHKVGDHDEGTSEKEARKDAKSDRKKMKDEKAEHKANKEERNDGHNKH